MNETKSSTLRVVSTDEHSWDVICWKLAKERNRFAVISVINSHEIFFTELCHYHDYQMKERDGKVLFAPVPILN